MQNITDILNNRGATIYANGESARNGFAVAGTTPLATFKASEVTQQIHDTLCRILKLWLYHGEAIGIWLPGDGTIEYNVSSIVLDKDDALELGRKRQQQSIFDLANNEVIQVTYDKE